MPTQSRTRRVLATTSFGTFGSVGPVALSPVLQEERARSWSNHGFRTKVDRARRIQQTGFLPTQPYTDDLQQVVNSKLINVYGRLKGYPSSRLDAVYSWWYIPPVARVPVSLDDFYLVNLEADMLDKLAGKLSGQGTNLPVTLCEAKSTVDMIYGAAQRLLISYRHVKQRRFKAAALALGLARTPRGVSRSQTVQQNWLEYRYGWRLVVTDVESLMKTLYDILTTKPIVYKAAVFKEVSLKWKNVFHNVPHASPTGVIVFRCTNTVDLERYYRIDCGYRYLLESVALTNGQRLGMLNPFVVGFELIPASFMLDWATNLGSVLEGLTAFQGKQFLDGWACRAMESRVQHQYSGAYPVEVASINEVLFTSPLVRERRFSRRSLSGFVRPQLRLNFDMNVGKTLDLLAIVKQVFLDRRS